MKWVGFTKMFFGKMLWIQVKWVGIVVSEVSGLGIVKLDLPFDIYCIVLVKGICWVHEVWECEIWYYSWYGVVDGESDLEGKWEIKEAWFTHEESNSK